MPPVVTDGTNADESAYAQSASAVDRARRLRQQLADVAGQLAETEDRVASVQEQLIEDDAEQAGRHKERAAEARRMAAHERAEQRRLAAAPEAPGGSRR
jgi:hypothetical protein